MPYFAGIDAGQTSTVAVVGTEEARIVGRGTAGPADEVAQDATSTRLHDALRGAISDALAHAGLSQDTQFARVVAGISGYEGRVYGRAPLLNADALTLEHDTVIAHAGALGGDPGVIVIAGTGSVAYAVDAHGRGAIAGGWGYLFGDEGSGFWFARRALADACQEYDAGRESGASSAMLQYFDVPTLRKLSRSFYTGGISRARFASFAALLLQQAQDGEKRAIGYVDQAAQALARIAMQAAQRAGLKNPRYALCGGMFASAALRERTLAQILALMPQARYVDARYDASIGALLLAYKAAGIHPESITE